MRQNKKAALLLCAATASVFFAPSALPDEPAATYPEEITIGTSQPSAPSEPLELSEVLSEASRSELTTGALNPALVCLIGAELENLAILTIPNNRIVLPPDEIIVGIASYYEKPQQTASGEQFDPDGFTAAAQLEIRDKFGGIKYGRLYQPAYAVVEYESKKLILKFNDVGPLRPGRKFDLSRAAMAYFGGLEKGLLPDVKVRPLPLGQVFEAGPVTDAQLAALGIGADMNSGAPSAGNADGPHAMAPETVGASPSKPANDTAALPAGEIVDAAGIDES
jgi:rare lipoprotein A (peptidoglycan hydrolase)